VKYGTVIGQETPIFVRAQSEFKGNGVFQPITTPYFTLIIKSRNFAGLQCEVQWLTSPAKPCAPCAPWHAQRWQWCRSCCRPRPN